MYLLRRCGTRVRSCCAYSRAKKRSSLPFLVSFKLLKDLIKRRCFASPLVSSPGVIALTGGLTWAVMAITMGRLPHIPHVDVPCPVLELADLSNIHPAPVVPDFDLIVRAYPDPLATLLQYDLFAGANRPFANALPLIGPQAEADSSRQSRELVTNQGVSAVNSSWHIPSTARAVPLSGAGKLSVLSPYDSIQLILFYYKVTFSQ